MKTRKETEKLLAGAARIDITPPVGTMLYGYRPDWASTSVHDGLSITALALSDGKEIVLLITAEICCIKTELCEEVRCKIAEETGVPKEHIIISCTHTHSGPNITGMPGWGGVDEEYYQQIFLPRILPVAQNAIKALEPAEVAVGEIKSLVGMNRREIYEDGSVGLGQNPFGCFDPYMTVVSIRNEETKEGILNLIHYGCHGTTAGMNKEITRDWSGVMIDRMEKETGILTAYWNGAIGDVGPRLNNAGTTGRGDIRYTEEHGGLAAMDAMEAYRIKGGYHKEALEIFTGTMKLPYSEMPDPEFVNNKLALYEDGESLVNSRRLEYEYYLKVKEYQDGGRNDMPPALEFKQTIIALGEVVFVPFPFEMFSEIVLRLRKYSPYRYTLSLSNTNGYYAYLPTKDQLCRGGYEIDVFCYGNVFRLAEDTDQQIISENLRILRQGNCEAAGN